MQPVKTIVPVELEEWGVEEEAEEEVEGEAAAQDMIVHAAAEGVEKGVAAITDVRTMASSSGGGGVGGGRGGQSGRGGGSREGGRGGSGGRGSRRGRGDGGMPAGSADSFDEVVPGNPNLI